MFRTAPAPTRSTNSFTIGFGLLSIPVSVYTGTEDTNVKRAEFITVTDDDGESAMHPVGRIAYDKVTNEVIESGVVRHAHDGVTDTWVPLSDEEIAECTMPKGLAEVVSFVPLTKLHQSYLTVGLAQVRAKTSGMKGAQVAHSQRAFGLFLAGLKDRKVAALVKVALRGPARFAAVTPEGDLLWLQPSDGIRQSAPLSPQVYTDAEMALVGNLIDTIGKGNPSIVDDTAAKVTAFVAAKAAGVEAPAPVVATEEGHIDLMATLIASVEAANKSGKPVAS